MLFDHFKAYLLHNIESSIYIYLFIFVFCLSDRLMPACTCIFICALFVFGCQVFITFESDVGQGRCLSHMSRGILDAPEEQHMYTNPDGETHKTDIMLRYGTFSCTFYSQT